MFVVFLCFTEVLFWPVQYFQSVTVSSTQTARSVTVNMKQTRTVFGLTPLLAVTIAGTSTDQGFSLHIQLLFIITTNNCSKVLLKHLFIYFIFNYFILLLFLITSFVYLSFFN